MRIKAFNEIMKDLKGAGTTNNDDEIEQLSKQLYAQGIASTMMEAKEKAKSMIQTEKDVTEEFTEKKEKLTTYNDPRSNPHYNKYREQKILEMRQRALGREPIQVQDEFQTPDFEKRNGSQGLPRPVGGSITQKESSEEQ